MAVTINPQIFGTSSNKSLISSHARCGIEGPQGGLLCSTMVLILGPKLMGHLQVMYLPSPEQKEKQIQQLLNLPFRSDSPDLCSYFIGQTYTTANFKWVENSILPCAQEKELDCLLIALVTAKVLGVGFQLISSVPANPRPFHRAHCLFVLSMNQDWSWYK